MIPTAGEYFGPYEILGSLGRGGVGEVYRAWDARLQREVALKVLHDDYPQHGNEQRFLIEARAASALNHPNICTVFDIGEKDGAPYLVMELLKGETLKQRIERGGIPSEEIAQYGSEIAEALGAAHALGIVHRDIKPANVMLVRQPDGRSRVKVLDFGLAKLTGPLPGSLDHRFEHLTVVGEAVGTVSYMSPEQARGDELDGRSDLFSLGVVMYEMATRRTPFQGSTSALLFVQLLNRDPEPIHDWNDSVPRALEKVISKLLEKDPARRFQTTVDVAAALHGVAARGSGSRWRRAVPPAVPLVRVEEPVARAGLPHRPDFRQERGVISLDLGSRDKSLPPAEPLRDDRMVSPVVRYVSGAHPVLCTPESTPRSRPSLPTPLQPKPAAPHHDLGRLDAADQSLAQASQGPEASPSAVVGNGEPGPKSTNLPRIGALAMGVATRPAASLVRNRFLVRAAAAGILLGALGGAFAASRLNQRPHPLLSRSDTLLITEVENHTAVQSFDGSIAAGLELSLSESPDLSVRGIAAYRAALHAMGADARPDSALQARKAAHTAGARAYLYGEVRDGEEAAHSTGVGYTVSVAVIDTASDRELAHAEARAARTQEIPGAIDEVAGALRNQLLGDPAGTAQPSAVPLAREASGNLNALRAYAAGARAQGENRPDAALKAYGTATAADPNFVQALIQISWLARELGSDLASAQAATRAQAASSGRSSRTAVLATIAARANATGDLSTAQSDAQHLAAKAPLDLDALLASARVLRLQGRFEEALGAAQQGIRAGTHQGDFYREAELSLLGLNRYDEALTVQDSAAAIGQTSPGVALFAAYLAGKDVSQTASNATDRIPQDPEALAARAAVLDNAGDGAAGAAAWREAAEGSRGQPGLPGAGTVLTARAALNRALAGDCTAAVAFGRDAATRTTSSPDSAYTAGMAGALCGDTALAHAGLAALSGPRTQAVQAPALRAASLLAEGKSDAAIAELGTIYTSNPSFRSDPSFLTLYVRALAHLAAHDAASSAQDFQQVLAHRGAALIAGTDVYPAAQLGLARALAASGDLMASQEAYSHFRQLWSGTPTADRLVAQAQAGTRPGIVELQAGQPPHRLFVARSTSHTSLPNRGRGAPAAREALRPGGYGEKALLSAWPDRPVPSSVRSQERRFQTIRDGDLE